MDIECFGLSGFSFFLNLQQIVLKNNSQKETPKNFILLITRISNKSNIRGSPIIIASIKYSDIRRFLKLSLGFSLHVSLSSWQYGFPD